MNKKLWAIAIAMIVVAPLALAGCKSKVEPATENEEQTDSVDVSVPVDETPVFTEPSQAVSTGTIPPTAAPPITEKPLAAAKELLTREKEIQLALRSAGFDPGPADGKIGRKTRKAIEDFQRSKGLKVDGKVGPKTWTELERYLNQ